jgi:hypothetical protein
MKVYRRSLRTGKTHVMELPVTKNGLDAYENGYGTLESIFPDLTPNQREFIKSGMTEEEFNSEN